MILQPGTATRLWGLHGATLTVDTALMMVGGNEVVTIPVPSFVIEHPKGLILFDTGLAPEAQADPFSVYGELAHHVGMNYPEEQLLERQLAVAGFRLEDVTHVICSHAHLDHTGGLYLFPQAKFYAGAADLRYAFWPDSLDAGNFRSFDLDRTRGFDWRPVYSDIDLFGDGSIQILHLPGHTPGNLSLVVRLPSQTFVLSGDTVHVREAFEKVLPMPSDYSTYDAKRSIERLAQVTESLDAKLWIGHDVADAKTFAFAPHFYE